jgi:hypothetical protein
VLVLALVCPEELVEPVDPLVALVVLVSLVPECVVSLVELDPEEWVPDELDVTLLVPLLEPVSGAEGVEVHDAADTATVAHTPIARIAPRGEREK